MFWSQGDEAMCEPPQRKERVESLEPLQEFLGRPTKVGKPEKQVVVLEMLHINEVGSQKPKSR